MSAREFTADHVLSGKIDDRHRQRLAVVYVRQSTPRQVLENRESTELQYALADRAVDLGWRRDRVLVIDEDLGQSGTSIENRYGFQRLMAEIALDHVGLVLGLQMSRLARSCKDWYHLLELCGVYGALLADHDGVYDPAQFKDRLFLGLQGMMSEAELYLIRCRMEQGLRQKAERGELFTLVPIGYVRTPDNRVTLDPDEQVQAAVHNVFEKFIELGSGRAVVSYLVREGMRLPVRPHYGPDRGQLVWRKPATATVYGILHNPIYAGAYSRGRQQIDARCKVPGRPSTGRRCQSMADWDVLLQDKLPAYISWDQYLANLERLQQNASRFDTRGAPREGASLLGGLAVCGRCGCRLHVVYDGEPGTARYQCQNSEPADPCDNPSVTAEPVDALIAEQVLRALEPASLELSLQVEQDQRLEQQRVTTHWRQVLERAHYETQRARRQYDAVDPENRLVARELESRWEEALREEQKLKEEHARFEADAEDCLQASDLAAIRALATDLPALWAAPMTSHTDRQEIVRHLLERVKITVQGKTELVDVTLHWQGGFTSQHEVCRPIFSYARLSNYEALKERVTALRRAGHTSEAIALQLNTEGYYPPRRDERFNSGIVRSLLIKFNLTKPRKATEQRLLSEHDWWLTDLSRELEIPSGTLRGWIRQGWVHYQKVCNRWVLWADPLEQERLRRLHAYRRPAASVPYPEELTTPKRRGA
jgi:DNA invertase Pin-like site-specific DNA recombinase